MITHDAVIAEARTWLLTPFHDQAALKGIGCDCIGLIRGVAKNLGLPEADAFANDIRFKGYARYPAKRLLLEGCDAYLDRIKINDTLPGDIALARIEIEPQHFAIISSLDPMRVIHSYIQEGKVVENIINDDWRAHVLRMYRFRGLE